MAKGAKPAKPVSPTKPASPAPPGNKKADKKSDASSHPKDASSKKDGDVERASGRRLDEKMIKQFVTVTLDDVVGTAAFRQKAARDWNVKIVENLTKKLHNSGDDRKFIVHSTLAPIGHEIALNVADMCYWSKVYDNAYNVKWESNSIVCIVFVHLISID